MPPDLWAGNCEHRPQSGPLPERLTFTVGDQTWFAPYVIAHSGGVPPDLAAIGFGNPEVSQDLRDLFGPDHLRTILHQDFKRDVQDGRFRVTGLRAGKRASIPYETLRTAGLDIEAATIGQTSEILVLLPLPGLPSTAPAEWTSKKERAFYRWLADCIDADSDATKRKGKSDWLDDAKRQFPGIPGEAFNRGWEVVAKDRPNMKAAGRKRKKIE